MKRSFYTVILSVAAFMTIGGCTSVRVSQDYNKNVIFSEMKTYAWKDAKQKHSGDVRIDTPFNDQRIRAAVDKTMTEKGYARTSGRPDVFVAYTYTLQRRLSGTSGGPVIGFGFGTGGRGSAIGFGAGTGSEISEYDEGQLVIDISDGVSGELLWQGTSVSRVDFQASPEKKTAFFIRMVEKNLSQFPPDHARNK